MTARCWAPALGLQAATTQAAWVGARVMLGFRALELGAGPVYLGALAASFVLPALVLAVPVGRLADRRGSCSIMLVGVLGAALGTAVALWPGSLVAVIVGSTAVGAGQLLIMVGQQTFTARAGQQHGTDRSFGTLITAASVGQLVGPPLVTGAAALGRPLDAPPDTGAGLLVCIGLVLLATVVHPWLRAAEPVLAAPHPRREAPAETGVGARHDLRRLWPSLVVSGAVLVTMDLMYAFMPVWAAERGVSATVVGYLLAVRAAVSVVSRLGLGRLVDAVGRRVLLVVSMSAAVAGLLALPVADVPVAVVAMVGLGIGLGLPQPLTMAWVVSLVEPRRHGAVLGLRLTVNRLAQVLLPLSVGATAGAYGAAGVFWANAALLGGAVVVTARGRPDG